MVKSGKIRLRGKLGEARWNGEHGHCYLRCGVRRTLPEDKAFGQKPESSEEGDMAPSGKHISSDGNELGAVARFKGEKKKKKRKIGHSLNLNFRQTMNNLEHILKIYLLFF